MQTKLYTTVCKPLVVFILFNIISLTTEAQFTEYFESFSNAAKSFTANSQSFTLTNMAQVSILSGAGVDANTPANINGSSNRYIDNVNQGAMGQVNSIKTSNAAMFTIKQLYVYLSANLSGTPNTPTGSVTFRGKLSGVTQFTRTISNGFPAQEDYSAYAAFIPVDFSTGTDQTEINIDELEIEVGGAFIYFAIDNFTFGSASVLPVTLTSFTATKQSMQVVLQWQTAQENNSNYFTIQYSQDGNNWSDAGRIIAAGNSDALKTYNFIHTSPVTGKNYYRLQQVDKDYKTAYSGIRYVDFNSPAPAALLSVYPNPVNENTFTVELKHEVQDPLPYTLINIIGKPVQRGFITNQKSVINIGNLNNGTYFLQIGQEKTVKVIKD